MDPHHPTTSAPFDTRIALQQRSFVYTVQMAVAIGSFLQVKMWSLWHNLTSPKVTIQKNKRQVSPFFFLLPVYLPCIVVLSLFLPVYMAWKWPKS